MIKLSSIIKAINELLKENFDIEVDGQNITDKFNRPSFRVEIDDLKTEALMTNFKKRSFVVRVYYFMKDRVNFKLEKLEMIEKLEDIFYLNLIIDEYEDGSKFLIPIDELNFSETDGVLIATFDSYTFEEIINDLDLENIENLSIK